MARKNKIRKDRATIVVQVIGYVLITLFVLCCLLPFILMITVSITPETLIVKNGFRLIPAKVTGFAYELIFRNPKKILFSYVVTIGMTGVGTILGLIMVSMAGYCLQRPDFVIRNHISFYIYFTTLFTGGLIPFYLLITKYFGLKDNYLAVLLPLLMNPWLIILMKNFMKSIPHSITESAKIDGAKDFSIFTRIILPLATPALATIGLFIALGYWNEWYFSMLFLTPNVEYRPMQLLLYNIVTQMDFIRNSAAASNVPPQDVPLESMKMAAAVVATGPVILFYPFVQKYFIKGITIGAVKG